MKDKRILVVAGPTAVGKTEYAIEAAKAFNGEIVSCDSMQVYRGMDIGSAKIRPEETEGVPLITINLFSQIKVAGNKEPDFAQQVFEGDQRHGAETAGNKEPSEVAVQHAGNRMSQYFLGITPVFQNFPQEK